MESKESNQKILVGLDSPSSEERVKAINSLSQSDLRDNKIFEKLKIIAIGDPDSGVQKAARKVTRYNPNSHFSFDLNAEFWLAFVFWLLLNIGLVILFLPFLSDLNLFLLLFIINIISIAISAYINPNMALGMITGLIGAIMLGPYIAVFYFIYWIWTGGAG